jgi:hypothetical protein
LVDVFWLAKAAGISLELTVPRTETVAKAMQNWRLDGFIGNITASFGCYGQQISSIL